MSLVGGSDILYVKRHYVVLV